jgi:hypothetical protein
MLASTARVSRISDPIFGYDVAIGTAMSSRRKEESGMNRIALLAGLLP